MVSRRAVLRSAGVAAVAGLAGCLSDGDGEGSGSDAADGGVDDDSGGVSDGATGNGGDAVAFGSETWSTFQADAANTGSSDVVAPSGEVTERWRLELDGAIEGGVAVADGTIFAGAGDGYLYAVDADTGEEQWSIEIGDWQGPYTVRHGVTVVDGTVVVGADDDNWDGAVHAVDAETGEEEWLYTCGEVQGCPTVADGTVYFGTHDNDVYALSLESGDRHWRNETEARAGIKMRSTTAVVDDTVYVTSDDRNVYALDAGSGAQQWAFEVEDPEAAPTVADGTVLVAGESGLWGIDADAGEKLWRNPVDDPIAASPAVADGVAYLPTRAWGSDSRSELVAIAIEDGQVQWRFDAGEEEDLESPPSIVDGTIFVGKEDGALLAIDAETGEEQWRHETGSEIEGYPAISGGGVFVGTDSGTLLALEGN